LLEQVGLGHQANQNLVICQEDKSNGGVPMLLASNPRLIMADEPTAALDSHSGHIVISLLRSLAKQGCTVLMVTHDPRIMDIADRVAYLEDGVLRQE